MEQTRSNSAIMTRALTLAGAERAPLVEFWTLTELGGSMSLIRGRDFEVWALQQRMVCAYRHEFRMGVRLRGKGEWGARRESPDDPGQYSAWHPAVLPACDHPFHAFLRTGGLTCGCCLRRSVRALRLHPLVRRGCLWDVWCGQTCALTCGWPA